MFKVFSHCWGNNKNTVLKAINLFDNKLTLMAQSQVSVDFWQMKTL